MGETLTERRRVGDEGLTVVKPCHEGRNADCQTGYSPSGRSSQVTELYDPKTFIAHAASHRQAFAHCERFSTAASRRSLGSVSVPVWLTILSDQLPVVALVGRYPANKLMVRGPLYRY